MIRFLRNKEIDPVRWDQCVRDSRNGMVYGFSWYLDRVSPGWEALVQDDYQAVFPLTVATRFGIRYLRQPPFAQQLGIFSPNPVTEEITTRFLDAIPDSIRFAEIQLNHGNPVNQTLFDSRIRKNHELDLDRTYETLVKNYSQNTRRNLRKALETGLTVTVGDDPGPLLCLFRENYGRSSGALQEKEYDMLASLIHHTLTTNTGFLLSSGTIGGKPDAAAFFLTSPGRAVFLFSASDFKTRSNGAMFLLIDHFIRSHAGHRLILDFEGGEDDELGRFYKSFGAAETGYPFVRMDRLPALAGKGRLLLKKLRGK